MADSISAGPSAVIPSAPIVNDTPPELKGLENFQAKAPEAKTPEVKAEPAKVEPPKSAKKTYKLKIDKSEENYDFDPSNDEEVVKHLQMSRAASKRMAEAAELRKVAMDFIGELKKNPRKVLSDPNIGIDVKKFAQEILNEEMKELEKSPEQREKEKLQKEVEDYKQQAKDRDEAFKKSEFERMQNETERNLEAGISAALDVGGIPKTPRTVARMAEMMMIALQHNIDLSPQDIVPLIKNNTMSEFKEIITALSDDQLEDFLGKEVLGRLRKKNVAKAKAAQTANQVKSIGQSKTKEEAKPENKQTIRQWLKI